MEDEHVSDEFIDDLIWSTHTRLERQGPGSREMTINALNFLGDLSKITKVLDLGCGTGGQTMVLAQNIPGSITGVDIYPGFIDVFNENAKKLNLHERVNGIVGSMDNLSFKKEEFDIIWSEGAIDGIGFEKCLAYWHGFLKTNGYIAVTSPSWLTNDYPVEIEKFWVDAGSEGLNIIGNNIATMQKCGYSFVASFTLPEKCWTENYFIPREAAEKELLEKYIWNKIVNDYMQSSRHEIELYSKYKQYYGYVFYIGKRL